MLESGLPALNIQYATGIANVLKKERRTRVNMEIQLSGVQLKEVELVKITAIVFWGNNVLVSFSVVTNSP